MLPRRFSSPREVKNYPPAGRAKLTVSVVSLGSPVSACASVSMSSGTTEVRDFVFATGARSPLRLAIETATAAEHYKLCLQNGGEQCFTGLRTYMVQTKVYDPNLIVCVHVLSHFACRLPPCGIW